MKWIKYNNMNRFSQFTEATRFLIVVLCATLVLVSCDKKENEEPEPTGSLTWKITDDGTLIVSGKGEIPDYGSSIDDRFYDINRDAITAVVIEDGITYVGDYAFAVCDNLRSVIIGNSVTAIGIRAFDYCQQLMSVTIGNSVTSIGESAFSNSVSLTKITIPNSVDSIGFWAFDNCSNLTVVNFNAVNCGAMGSKGRWQVYSAFENCSNLTTVNIGSEVTRIPTYGFSGCRSISKIVNYASTPQTFNGSAFNVVNKTTCKLRVSATSVDAYKAATGWSDFDDIVAIE